MADWSRLPYHILLKIFLCLDKIDQIHCSLTNKKWNEILDSTVLWKSVTLRLLYGKRDDMLSRYIKRYGDKIEHLDICFDAGFDTNRKNFCDILSTLGTIQERKLETLRISSDGYNIYSKDIYGCLMNFFRQTSNNMIHIDLKKINIPLYDDLIYILSENNRNIESINIQTYHREDSVTQHSILRLVQRCRNIKELCIHDHSFSNNILLELMKDDRVPIEKIDLIYGTHSYQNIYLWEDVVKKLPRLKVTLRLSPFDTYLPITRWIKPWIPVEELKIDKCSLGRKDILLAAEYYSETLKSVMIKTTNIFGKTGIDNALIVLASVCTNLHSLYVDCILDKKTIDEILSLRPNMKKLGTYKLISS